jgi:nitrilase
LSRLSHLPLLPRNNQKCVSLIHDASSHDAPETYIPAFPIWSSILFPAQNHSFFSRIVEESIYADGEEVLTICQAAKQAGIVVSVGIPEKVRYSSATLFNTNLIIGSDGDILIHHRKLMPTFFGKLTWAPGDGHGLKVIDAAHAKIGMLICGENTNPLARYALMAQGEQVHISSWPAIWPTRLLERPESSEHSRSEQEHLAQYPKPSGGIRGANYDNITANKTRAAAHCFEAKCFGIICSGYLDQSAVNTLLSNSEGQKSISDTLELSSRTATMFLDPTGALLPGFTVDPVFGRKQWKNMLQME